MRKSKKPQTLSTRFDAATKVFYDTRSNTKREQAIKDIFQIDQEAKSGSVADIMSQADTFWRSYSRFTDSLTGFSTWAPRVWQRFSTTVEIPPEYKTNDDKMDGILMDFIWKGRQAVTEKERKEVFEEVSTFWPASRYHDVSENDTADVRRSHLNHDKSRSLIGKAWWLLQLYEKPGSR